MLRFGNEISKNLKIGELPVTLAISIFQKLFVMNFDSNQVDLK